MNIEFLLDWKNDLNRLVTDNRKRNHLFLKFFHIYDN